MIIDGNLMATDFGCIFNASDADFGCLATEGGLVFPLLLTVSIKSISHAIRYSQQIERGQTDDDDDDLYSERRATQG